MRLTSLHIKEHSLYGDHIVKEGEKIIWSDLSNELDVEHNVLDDRNDGSSREGHVQNVENEDRGQNVNWKMDFT